MEILTKKSKGLSETYHAFKSILDKKEKNFRSCLKVNDGIGIATNGKMLIRYNIDIKDGCYKASSLKKTEIILQRTDDIDFPDTKDIFSTCDDLPFNFDMFSLYSKGKSFSIPANALSAHFADKTGIILDFNMLSISCDLDGYLMSYDDRAKNAPVMCLCHNETIIIIMPIKSLKRGENRGINQK